MTNFHILLESVWIAQIHQIEFSLGYKFMVSITDVVILNPNGQHLLLILDWDAHSFIPCRCLTATLDDLRFPTPELIVEVQLNEGILLSDNVNVACQVCSTECQSENAWIVLSILPLLGLLDRSCLGSLRSPRSMKVLTVGGTMKLIYRRLYISLLVHAVDGNHTAVILIQLLNSGEGATSILSCKLCLGVSSHIMSFWDREGGPLRP